MRTETVLKGEVTLITRNGKRYAAPKGSADFQPIVNDNTPFDFRPNSMDRKTGVAGSFTQCALANAVKRQKGVVWVAVGRSIAYVGFTDKVVRYELSEKAFREVVANDIAPMPGLLATPGTIRFKPTRPTKTLEGKKATIAKHAARKAAGKTTFTGPRTIHTDPLAAYGVRNGS